MKAFYSLHLSLSLSLVKVEKFALESLFFQGARPGVIHLKVGVDENTNFRMADDGTSRMEGTRRPR